MSFASQLHLSREHGYVVGALTGSAIIVQIYGAGLVVKARKEYDVKYPKLYADGDSEAATKFNCVQRGHQNVLENIATHYMLTMVSSLYRPGVAAIASGIRALGFVFYMKGYASGKPNGRYKGAFGFIGFFMQLGLVGELMYKLLKH
eukprot:comp25398_c0_seq1/m.46991 comp25398_c0_seq1/g.46991  ORF comp25398_c0_seq1/g.46991 comp25398_c0_seq1/m.46991 type:complete len:147 (-) comp25398_c0_seq1:253-693(-)